MSEDETVTPSSEVKEVEIKVDTTKEDAKTDPKLPSKKKTVKKTVKKKVTTKKKKPTKPKTSVKENEVVAGMADDDMLFTTSGAVRYAELCRRGFLPEKAKQTVLQEQEEKKKNV